MARIPSAHPLIEGAEHPLHKHSLHSSSGFTPEPSTGLLLMELSSSPMGPFRTSPNLDTEGAFPTTYLPLALNLVPD